MTKQQIKDNNEFVIDLFSDIDSIWNGLPQHGPFVPFRHCQATTRSARNEEAGYDITFLYSYHTCVAVVYRDKVNKRCICVDVLRYVYGYTSTSAQHISKFFHDFVDGYAKRYDCEVIKYRYETERG